VRAGRIHAGVASAIVFVACARALPPPGGETDRLAPRIVATVPEALAVVPDFEGPVIFRFDERLSERGITGSVLVSPTTGEVRISRSGSEIKVEVEGGWLPDVTYRVLVAPGLRDLFNNERREPAELVFSTGPPITSTVIGGLVIDRITGRAANQVIVEATRRADSLRYITVADSQAFFTFRSLPTGIYDMLAYSDQNRNRRRDPAEMLARGTAAPLNSERDTFALDLAVVPADTTPPRLTRADGRDSLQIRMFTDDWLEPLVALAAYRVRILTFPDSEEVGAPIRLMRTDTFQIEMQARADSIRRDSLARDSTRAPPDSARPPVLRPPPNLSGRGGIATPPQPGGRGGLPPVGPLPYQELVVIPARPLVPGEYVLEVGGLQNISSRSGGGGSVRFTIPEPRKPPPDTTRRPPPDTGRVRARRPQ
jgi:Bacterial Ig-like domain